jgi:hypothetical protein
MLASDLCSDLAAGPRIAAGQLLGKLMIREQTADLASLIHNFADCELLEADIEGDGYFLPAGLLSPKMLIVVQARTRHKERRRFTLAHELGHLACHHNRRRGLIRDEERWCDDFAAELLMPKPRVDAFAQKVVTLADWLDFPDRFGVSKLAAALQLWEYCGVIMITGKLNAKPRDRRYAAARLQLMELAAATRAEGDTLFALADGTECLVRWTGNKGYSAVARI